MAARVKVTINSSEADARPSAMNRVARSARVYVLPVPALAWMATLPRGRGSARSNRMASSVGISARPPAAGPGPRRGSALTRWTGRWSGEGRWRTAWPGPAAAGVGGPGGETGDAVEVQIAEGQPHGQGVAVLGERVAVPMAAGRLAAVQVPREGGEEGRGARSSPAGSSPRPRPVPRRRWPGPRRRPTRGPGR